MPQSYYPAEPEKLDLTRADGLPRVVRYQDEANAESLHVAYLPVGSDVLHTMLADRWPPPLPTDPTPEASTAAIAARQQAAIDMANAATQLRQQVLALAQGTVGMRVDAAFTTAQLRSLLAILLYKVGALNNDLTIRPLGDWVR